MSWTKEVTIWCNGCGAWERSPYSRVKNARIDIHRNYGWVTIENEDICPNCLADLKAGIPLPSDEDYNADN